MEAKTDYKARLSLLESGKARLIIRKTNKYIIVQLVQSDIARDKVIASAVSKELLNKGWPEEFSGSLKSRPAAYLTGFLIGLKAKGKDAILDIGMNRNVHKSRLYAALKGALDAGLHIPHNKDALPSDDMIEENQKLKLILNKIKQNIK